jgi:putative endonuclease
VKSPAVYILANKPRGVLYIGVTSNLVQRVWQHREGVADGFTKRYGARMLVWYELHPTMIGAITREKALKKWLRRQKLDLITKSNHEWRDLWPDLTGTATVVARALVTPATSLSPALTSAVDPRLRRG